MRYILTFVEVVISIVTAMQRMATSLRIKWQKTLKLYSKNVATMHPDTTEHLSFFFSQTKIGSVLSSKYFNQLIINHHLFLSSSPVHSGRSFRTNCPIATEVLKITLYQRINIVFINCIKYFLLMSL